MKKLSLHSSEQWAIHHAFMQIGVLEAPEIADQVEKELCSIFYVKEIRSLRKKGEVDAHSPAYETLRKHKDLFDTMEVFRTISNLIRMKGVVVA